MNLRINSSPVSWPNAVASGNMRPYLRAANATWQEIALTDVMEMNFNPSEFACYELKYGDILLSQASGSLAKLVNRLFGKTKFLVVASKILFRVQPTSVEPEYLLLHFRKDAQIDRFGKIVKGVGIHYLGGKRLDVMPVAIPLLSEQVRIVAEVERRLSIIDQHEKAVEANLARAARLRQSILKRAFTGQLVPQDPNDESASVLLARIKAARLGKAKPEQMKLKGI